MAPGAMRFDRLWRNNPAAKVRRKSQKMSGVERVDAFRPTRTGALQEKGIVNDTTGMAGGDATG
jgi:hypothetical protein